MPFPTTPNLQKRINREAFYTEIEEAQNERVWPKIAEKIPQDVASVIRVGMGQVPKPEQVSGSTAGQGGIRAKSLKDYQQTTTVVSWDLSVTMPRDVVEDLPEEPARIGREHGESASVWFDERAINQLDSTTALGYDTVALYSDSHSEFGTQDNARTSAAATGTKPTAAEVETALEDNLPALRNFTDDQGHFVNEGVSGFTILIPPDFEWVYRGVLDPTLSQQAIDASGITGKFRGMFDIIVSGHVPNDRHFIFAKTRRRRALGCFLKTDWDYNSNIGTASDAWQHGRTAIFTGYARFEFLPRHWSVTVRHIYT
jgi:hypothetical protein